jgi:hypothetical protein
MQFFEPGTYTKMLSDELNETDRFENIISLDVKHTSYQSISRARMVGHDGRFPIEYI